MPFNSWQSYFIASHFLLFRARFAKRLGPCTADTQHKWQVMGKMLHFTAVSQGKRGAGRCERAGGRLSGRAPGVQPPGVPRAVCPELGCVVWGGSEQ